MDYTKVDITLNCDFSSCLIRLAGFQSSHFKTGLFNKCLWHFIFHRDPEFLKFGNTLDQIILGTGIDEDHFRVIEPIPRNHEQNVAVLKEELAFDGPSVIIARRACIEAQKRKVV